MLRYLANSARPEIHMEVHQTARYSINSMRIHELAIMRIGPFLVDNTDRGVIYTIYKTRGIEFYVDADFVGGWDLADSSNAENFLLRTGFLSVMKSVPSSGVANFKLRSHFLLLKLSTFPCLKRYVKHYQSNGWQRKSTALFLSTLQQQTSASQSTDIIYFLSQ